MGRLLILATAVCGGAMLGQDGTHKIFSGPCSLKLSGVDYPQEELCPGAVKLHVPSAAERQSGTPSTLRIQLPHPNAPVVTLTLSGATPAGDPKNERIEFAVQSIAGAPSLAVLATDRFVCTHSRGPLTSLDPETKLECILQRGGETLFRFGFRPNPSSMLAYRGSVQDGYSGLTGGKRYAANPTSPPPAPKAAPAPVSTTTTAAAVKPVVSNDPKAIFGLMPGTPLPSMPYCNDEEVKGRLMPADIPFCTSRIGSELEKMFGGVKEEFTQADFQQMGLSLVSIFINEKIYDVKVTDNVTAYVDRANVIQRVKLTTSLRAVDGFVLSVLTNKYGNPSRQDSADWTNPQSGALVARTPNYYWDFPNLLVDYFSRDRNILNQRSPLGAINVYAPAYFRILKDFQARRGAPPPGKKGM